jgi:hypothetical protein
MVWFGWFMVFNATFNNISVILWQSVLMAEKITDLSQVTDNLLSHYVVSSTPRLRGFRTHNFSGVYPTTMRSRPRWPLRPSIYYKSLHILSSINHMGI